MCFKRRLLKSCKRPGALIEYYIGVRFRDRHHIWRGNAKGRLFFRLIYKSTRNHPGRCGRRQLHLVRTSMEQSPHCREVGFEMAIYWYRVAEDINSDAFARRAVTASDSTCPADGVSLALMSTLLLIPDSFCAGTNPYRIAPDESVEDEILPMILLNTGLT